MLNLIVVGILLPFNFKERSIKPDENGDTKTDAANLQEKDSPPKEIVSFIVIHNKNKFDVQFPFDETVSKLKQHLQNIISKYYCSERNVFFLFICHSLKLSLDVPQALQKVMFKGLAKDDKTLREIGITPGVKVMVVGSKLDDVLAVSTPSTLVSITLILFLWYSN